MFCSVQSQRPWHAGNNSNRLSQVLPQYIDERIAAEQAVQAAQAGTENQGQTGVANQGQAGVASQGQAGVANQGQAGVASQGQAGPTNQSGQGTQTAFGTDLLGNRIGGSTVAPAAASAAAAAAPASSTIIPFDLPVDAHGDIDLINRIKTWPRDKQPFWYLNWQAIQAHRGDANNSAQPVQTQPDPTSFFAG